MHRKSLLLILSVFALSSCDLLSMVGLKKENTDQTQVNEKEESDDNQENHSTTTDDNTGSNTNTNDDNTGSNTQVDDTDETENTPFSLENWENFSFHEGNEPVYNDYWTFYYGSSKNPNGRLWQNPSENSSYSGVEFVKNCQIISPLFNSWTKIECRFTFWFSSHTSSSYSATANQPQFKLESYDSNSTLLETQNIEITKSNIPNNNSPYVKQIYITQPTATHFILKWNNYIANGSSGYSAILCDVGLKGWPYN